MVKEQVSWKIFNKKRNKHAPLSPESESIKLVKKKVMLKAETIVSGKLCKSKEHKVLKSLG